MSVERQRLLPWLLEQIDSGEIPGVEWTNKKRTEFKIPWKHAGKPGFDIDKHAALFRKWAIHTEKYKPGEKEDPSTWKTRFRCALYKLPDLEEVKGSKNDNDEEPFRIYRVKSRTEVNNNDSVMPTSTTSAAQILSQDVDCILLNTLLQDSASTCGIMPTQSPLNMAQPYFDGDMEWDTRVAEYSDSENSPDASSLSSEDLHEYLEKNGHCSAFEETCDINITLPDDLETVLLDPLPPIMQFNFQTTSACQNFRVPPAVVPNTSTAQTTKEELQDTNKLAFSNRMECPSVSQSNQTTISTTKTQSISLQPPHNMATQGSPPALLMRMQAKPQPPSQGLGMRLGIKVEVYYLNEKVKEDEITSTTCRISSGNGINNLSTVALSHDEQQIIKTIYGDSNAQQIQLPAVPDTRSLLNQLLQLYFVRGILIEQTDDDIYVTRLCQSRVYWNQSGAQPIKLERENKTLVFSLQEFKEQCRQYSLSGQTSSRPSAGIFLSVARNYNGLPNNIPLITIAMTHAQASQELASINAGMSPELLLSFPNANDEIAIQVEGL